MAHAATFYQVIGSKSARFVKQKTHWRGKTSASANFATKYDDPVTLVNTGMTVTDLTDSFWTCMNKTRAEAVTAN